ncbi:MAG: VWA domain-containing protein [Bryobacteraceae bacterium]|jgi:VWFA-related protein
MDCSARLTRVVFAVAIAAGVGQPQMATGQAQAPPPLITATTRLVQVSVIARDKNGEPAAGLKAEDFRVEADGRPQKISFFSADSTGISPAPGEPLPPGTFTNILAARGQAVNGITVVLLDLVNTRMADRMFARQQLIKYLEEIQPQDRIGVYVFSGRLRVLHEYTADMADFQKKLADAKSRLIGVNTEVPGALDQEQSEFDMAFAGRGGTTLERQFYMRDRVMGTLAVFKFIANHLERVPGRKNLVWVSGAFPMIFGYENMNNMAEGYVDEVDATVRALSQANVAVYPIDARGLTTPPGFNASRASTNSAPRAVPSSGINHPHTSPSAPRPSNGGGASRSQNAAHDTMEDIAHRTGGRAYYNTNDLARAIHEAVADSTLTYTIGFYPTDEKSGRDFHKIKVETPRQHLNLHYRSGYLDVPPASSDQQQRLLQMHDALWSPMDATELGLTVHATRSADPPTVDLLVTIQPDGVQLKQDGDRYSGRLDMLMVQRDSRGNELDGPFDTIELKMLGDTYRKFTTAGLPVHKTLPLSARAETLRIVVRDAGSGMIGSLTVPLTGP